MWQKAVFEKAHRLVRLHEVIEFVEAQPKKLPPDTESRIEVRVFGPEGSGEFVQCGVLRQHFLALLVDEEQSIMQDMARILRQVTE